MSEQGEMVVGTEGMANSMIGMDQIHQWCEWMPGDAPNTVYLSWDVLEDVPMWLDRFSACLCSSMDGSVSVFVLDDGRWAWTSRFSAEDFDDPVLAAVRHVYHSIQVAVARDLNGATCSSEMIDRINDALFDK